jgi:hypothetical protein
VTCVEETPGVGRVYFDVTANYSVLPDPGAGTQGFTRTRKVDGVTYAQDSTGFSLYGAGVYASPTSHPPFSIPPGATAYTFTLEELLIVNDVQTSITAITVRCDDVTVPGGPTEWVGTVIGVSGDPALDEASSGPGSGVPDNPSNAGGHSNPHACADNPGRANEHRPDNVPPCRPG